MEAEEARAVLVTPAEGTLSDLSETVAGAFEQAWEDAWLDKDPAVVVDCFLEEQVDMVVLGPELDVELAELWAIELASRNIRVITFVGDLKAKEIVTLTRAGVTDFLEADADEDEWNEMLARGTSIAERLQAPLQLESPAECRLVAVVTPRGGAGRTTIATNLAVGLSAHTPLVLVDLDVQFGGVASGLDLTPEHTMFDAAEMVRTGLDPIAMKVLLDRHPDGPYVLSAPATLSEAEAMNGEDSADILRQLMEMFPVVIVDCAGGMNEHTLAALSLATDVVLVGTPDTASLETIRRACEVMDTVGFNPVRHVVLNRTNKRSKGAPKIFEQSLGVPVLCELPESRNVAESFQRGVPFFRHGSRDPASRAVQTLMDQFLGPAPAVITQGLFRR